MGKRSTVTGYWREQGGTNSSSSKLTGPSPRVMTSLLKVEFDASVAVADIPRVILPSGSRVLSARSTGNASAGTVAVRTSVDPDGFAVGIAASTVADQATGALIGTLLTADTQVQAGDNTAGAGTAVIYLEVAMDDDGARAD